MAAAAEDAEPPEDRPRSWLPEALPALGPVAMRIYVALWSLLLIAAVALPVVGRIVTDQVNDRDRFLEIGLLIGGLPGGEGVQIRQTLSREARAAGAQPGDRLIALNNRPLPPLSQLIAESDRLFGAEGSRVEITLASGQDTPRVLTLTRRAAHVDERYEGTGLGPTSYYFIARSYVLIHLALVIAAVLLFRQRRKPVPALLSISFLALSATSFAATNAPLGFGGELIADIVQQFAYWGFLNGMLLFPSGRFEPRWTLAITAAITLYGLWLVTVTLTGTSMGWLEAAIQPAIQLAILATLIIRYRKLPAGVERQQLRWAFFALTIGVGIIAAQSLFQLAEPELIAADSRWNVWSRAIIYLAHAIGYSIIPLGLVVALLRYRLYDADAVIGRSAGYAVLTLLMAGVFGASAKLIEWMFEAGFGEEAGALPGAIGAGLAVVLITPMNGRIQAWAERRFRKGLIALKTDIPDVANDLRETASLSELLDEVLARVNRGVRATRSAVMMDGALVAQRGEASEEGAYPLVISLRTRDAGPEVATMLVGPRPDGTSPGRDERGVLNDVSAPVARAIEVVLRRQAREAKLDARFEAIEKNVEALATRQTRGPSAAAK